MSRRALDHGLSRGAPALLCFVALALQASAARATTILEDYFEDGVTAWTPSNGAEWAPMYSDTTSYTYRRAGTLATWNDSTSGNNTWTNESVEADVRVNAWNAPGSASYMVALYARYTGTSPGNSSCYYLAIRADGSMAVRKRMGGSNTSLANFKDHPVMADDWVNVRLEVVGTGPVQLNMYLNGVLRARVTDSGSPIAAGRVGVGSYGADVEFDNLMVSNGDIRGAESDIVSGSF